MKKLLLLGFLPAIFLFNACKEDEGDTTVEPEYQIQIMSPDSADKTVGDNLHIHVEFEDQNGGTVHHINIRVYDKATGTEIYNMPASAHVHKASPYSYEDDLTLAVDPDTDWVLEAKVWGHDDGVAETSEKLEFHVKQ